MTTRARTVSVKETAFGQDMLEVLAERQLEKAAYHGLAVSQSIVTLKEHLVKKLSHGKWKIDPGLCQPELRCLYPVYADTGMEFPEMKEHMQKLDELLFLERGLHITTLRHPKGFEWLMFEEPKVARASIEKRKLKGTPLFGNGWPGPRMRWCTGHLKVKLMDRAINQMKGEANTIRYVGIAADESHRCKQDKEKRYPLVEWGITEAQALQICYDRGFDWGGLYEIYNRCSCWCCPLQRIGELRQHHPELWRRLLDMDKRTLAMFGDNPLGRFRKNWIVEQLDQRFAEKERKQANLHGRLTHDMELKTTPNGISVCRFCVAVESGYGEKKRVDFIDCVAWRSTAEFLCKHFAKGQETALCGRLETQTWEDKEGRKRKTVEVHVREADFCGKRESSPPAGESELLEGFEELLDDGLPFG